MTKILDCGDVGIQFFTSRRNDPATYKIRALFPNRSSDYVKMKIILYFSELDNEMLVESIVVPTIHPRETVVPTTVITPVSTQPPQIPTEILVKTHLSVCAAAVGIFNILLVFGRK